MFIILITANFCFVLSSCSVWKSKRRPFVAIMVTIQTPLACSHAAIPIPFLCTSWICSVEGITSSGMGIFYNMYNTIFKSSLNSVLWSMLHLQIENCWSKFATHGGFNIQKMVNAHNWQAIWEWYSIMWSNFTHLVRLTNCNHF